MTTFSMEEEGGYSLDRLFASDHLSQTMGPFVVQFEQIVRSFVFFNLFFLTIGFVEIVLLLVFFATLTQSSILAFSLAFVFLTFFSYYTLRVYFLTKKPAQFLEIKDQFIQAFQKQFSYREGVPEHYIAMANACCRFADLLHRKEYAFYPRYWWMARFNPWIEKMSCWLHWHDVHRMKEILLIAAVEENIKLVKSAPTNLEFHVALANAYVMLSGLYVDPRTIQGYDEDRWMPNNVWDSATQEKFRLAAECAIEEFKILNDYAPNDPWVHAQLAYSYHDLQMPEEEIREYEILLKLNPDDKDTLYKLGTLYFQQGLNAQGLRVYEELKRCHYKKAEALIDYYGGYTAQVFF